MTQIFRKIRKGLEEYFLGTETKKYFKEKGRSYLLELTIGKYIPDILDAGVIAGSIYFTEPKALGLLIYPELLRLASMGNIRGDKNWKKDAELDKFWEETINELLKRRQAVIDLEEISKSLQEQEENRNLESHLN